MRAHTQQDTHPRARAKPHTHTHIRTHHCDVRLALVYGLNVKGLARILPHLLLQGLVRHLQLRQEGLRPRQNCREQTGRGGGG